MFDHLVVVIFLVHGYVTSILLNSLLLDNLTWLLLVGSWGLHTVSHYWRLGVVLNGILSAFPGFQGTISTSKCAICSVLLSIFMELSVSWWWWNPSVLANFGVKWWSVVSSQLCSNPMWRIPLLASLPSGWLKCCWLDLCDFRVSCSVVDDNQVVMAIGVRSPQIHRYNIPGFLWYISDLDGFSVGVALWLVLSYRSWLVTSVSLVAFGWFESYPDVQGDVQLW